MSSAPAHVTQRIEALEQSGGIPADDREFVVRALGMHAAIMAATASQAFSFTDAEHFTRLIRTWATDGTLPPRPTGSQAS